MLHHEWKWCKHQQAKYIFLPLYNLCPYSCHLCREQEEKTSKDQKSKLGASKQPLVKCYAKITFLMLKPLHHVKAWRPCAREVQDWTRAGAPNLPSVKLYECIRNGLTAFQHFFQAKVSRSAALPTFRLAVQRHSVPSDVTCASKLGSVPRHFCAHRRVKLGYAFAVCETVVEFGLTSFLQQHGLNTLATTTTQLQQQSEKQQR